MRLLYFVCLVLHAQFSFSDDSTMGNCASVPCNPLENDLSQTSSGPLPIETIFKLPSPLPSWPSGGGFASGIIDLGDLQVSQVSNFTKVWASHEGGGDNLGATFYEPSAIPDGFFMLGCYSQPNNRPLFGWVLAAKDATIGSSSQPILQMPTDYTLIWSSESLNIKQDGVGYIWLPTPPEGYMAIGHVITNSSQKPSLDKIRCVRSDFTDVSENGSWIWGNGNGINVYNSRPRDRGTQFLGVSTGAFIAQTNSGAGTSLVCLKNIQGNLSAMPNLDQIQALVQEYSPWVYFHPDEQFFPSSVNWFFQNGALLYTKGQESSPVAIDLTGSNLPQGSSNDGAYWLDLPTDNEGKDRVKRGDLQNATMYLHVKPMLGATFTDIAVWLFYPFNGPARAKVEFITISLGKIGEHVGDWEHITLRISNFNGELKEVYFSQHSSGTWMSASQLEFQNSNKPVVYSSLHGHAAYPKAGDFLQGGDKAGIRNEAAKSNMFMDTGAKFSIVCTDHLESIIVQPPWLNYAREWGPKVDYSADGELKKMTTFFPGKLKTAFKNIVSGLPKEVLGEQGPTGPMWKDNWSGDELD